MSKKFSECDIIEFHKAYMSGESTCDIAKRIGCHSSTLRNRFHRMGLPVRDSSESKIVLNAQLSAEARTSRASAAHDAVRGKKHSFEQLCRRAIGVEAAPHNMPSTEQAIYNSLLERGLFIIPQKAVGKYNLDFAVNGTVAVEIYGGGWHAKGSHARRHEERTRYILDAGFHVVIIWTHQLYDARVGAINEIISLLEQTSSNPTMLRQYRVIWCNGDIVHSVNAQDDNFPFKPAFKMLRDSEGRYYRAAD